MPQQTNLQRAEPADLSLIMTRTFAAPQPLVWSAFTDATKLRQWMGPRHCPSIAMAIDLRPGGAWHGTLRTVDGGRELDQGGVYREIAAPDRLSFTFAWDKSDGTPGLETLITVTFTAQDDRTQMHFRQDGFLEAAARDGHQDGWNSSFDRLAEHLARHVAHRQS